MNRRFIYRFSEIQEVKNGIIGRCIITNGCFDILHPGHIRLLSWFHSIAQSEDLFPIVALNSDKSVRQIKGISRPIVPEESRAQLISNLQWPFSVVIFDEENPQKLMDFFKPAVVVKGSEYSNESVIKWEDSEVITIGMLPNWSTSAIIGDRK